MIGFRKYIFKTLKGKEVMIEDETYEGAEREFRRRCKDAKEIIMTTLIHKNKGWEYRFVEHKGVKI